MKMDMNLYNDNLYNDSVYFNQNETIDITIQI